MKKKKIIFLGGSGIIAESFSKNLKDKFQILRTHYKNPKKNSIFFDVKKNSIDKLINIKNRPDVIIYGAGISNHTYCAKNKMKSRATNVTANIKKISEIIKSGTKIIFLSTQLVYQGNKGGYKENDISTPCLEYARQKLDVEKFILKNTKNYLILRLAKVIGLEKNKKDPINYFLKDLSKDKKIKLATDQVTNYLYSDDLDKILKEAIDKNICGVFNIGGPKAASRYNFYLNFLKEFDLPNLKLIEKCKIHEIDLYEEQPKDTSFDLSKFNKFFKSRPKNYIDFSKKIVNDLKKNQNVLVIGNGFFSQNIYLPILKLFFKKDQIFLYDERKILKKKTSEFFGYKYLNNISKSELKKNNIKICFLCFERTKSFYYAKKILSAKIHLFGEKPLCDNFNDIKFLKRLSEKNKVIFDGSFQRLFDKNVVNLKNKIDNSKSLKLECIFESGNFRHNKKTLIRTNEKLKLSKNKKDLNFISYLIFLNRYWHIVNLVNYFTNYIKLKKNKIKFIKYDMFTYYLEILNDNLEIKLHLSSKKITGWNEKYFIENENKTKFKLDAPMKFSKKNYRKTSFCLQIKNFIDSVKILDNDRIDTFGAELKFIENLWFKNV